jgi:hypothetical protein
VTLGLFIGIWTVVTPEIEAALGGGPGRLGLVLTGALVVAAAANTVGGALAERRGTSAALRLTLAWWAVALAVGTVAPAPWGVALGIVMRCPARKRSTWSPTWVRPPPSRTAPATSSDSMRCSTSAGRSARSSPRPSWG